MLSNILKEGDDAKERAAGHIWAWLVCCLVWFSWQVSARAQSDFLQWSALPPLPDELGLAGPVVGIHDDVLVAGGGANFARPVWDNPKQWHAHLYVLDLRRTPRVWQAAGSLAGPLAYSACASTPYGIAIVGGNNQQHETSSGWLLRIKRTQSQNISVDLLPLPGLPQPLVYGQAVWLEDRLVVLSGQTGSDLSSAIAGGWSVSLKDSSGLAASHWQPIATCPGGARAFAMAASVKSQPDQLWIMGGRRQSGETVEFLSDVWQYSLSADSWQASPNLPVPVAAGGAAALGDMLAVVSGDDGALFTRTDELRDNHPGFAKRTWLFDLSTQRWRSGGPSPANQVTTTPVVYGDRIFLISGEIRPRVRTNQVWQIGVFQP